LVASLAIERMPVVGPPDCALKVTLKAIVCPAPIVTGKVKWLTAKLGLETSTREMVTLDAPELVIVSDKVWPRPFWMLPKLRLAGFEMSVPGAMAMAETGTLTSGFGALLVIARFPLAFPADLGATVTAKVLLCPGDKVSGNPSPLIWNP